MFNDYQKKATAVFKPVKSLTKEHTQLLDWCLGLGGETGEVLDLLKHVIYHEDTVLDKMELAKELGDVLWYISAIATTCGIDLNDVAALNDAKLSHRFSNGYSAVESANRHSKEQAFKDTPVYKCLEARILNTQRAPLNIIVVGPDGSGKTTFTTKLAELTGKKRIKCDYRQPDKPQLAKQLLTTELDVIYDRFYYPDEIIYSKIKNIPLEQDYLKELFSVFMLLEKVNPVIIYMDAPVNVLIERSKFWADDYVNTTDLRNIQAAYEEWLILMKEAGIPVIEIDTGKVEIDTDDYKAMLKEVVDTLYSASGYYGTSSIIEEVHLWE